MASENKNPLPENTDNENPVAEENENAEAKEKKTRMLTLKSSDGEEFSISESAALLSVTIKSIMEEGCTGEIPLLTVDGRTLAQVITYLNKHAEGGVTDEEKKKFDEAFVSGQEMQFLFRIVLATNYLEIKDLIDTVCQKIADRMKNKSARWARKTFNIENDFTPEEEEEIKQQHAWTWEGVDPDDDDD